MIKVILLALFSILVWSVSSVQNAAAETGSDPGTVTANTQAGTTQGKGSIVSKRLESITKRLGLSAQQQVDVRTVLKEDEAALNDIHADANLTITERRAKAQELRDSTNSKIRALLTPEQQIRHDEILLKIEERRQDKMNRGSIVIPTN